MFTIWHEEKDSDLFFTIRKDTAEETGSLEEQACKDSFFNSHEYLPNSQPGQEQSFGIGSLVWHLWKKYADDYGDEGPDRSMPDVLDSCTACMCMLVRWPFLNLMRSMGFCVPRQ